MLCCLSPSPFLYMGIVVELGPMGLQTAPHWPGFPAISALVSLGPQEEALYINSYDNLLNVTTVQSRRGWRYFQMHMVRESPKSAYPEER